MCLTPPNHTRAIAHFVPALIDNHPAAPIYTCDAQGGVLYLRFGRTNPAEAIITGSTFVQNQADSMGVIASYDLVLIMMNNFFTGNIGVEFADTMFLPGVQGGGSACPPGRFGKCTPLGFGTDGSYSCAIDVCTACPAGTARTHSGAATAADCTPCGA